MITTLGCQLNHKLKVQQKYIPNTAVNLVEHNKNFKFVFPQKMSVSKITEFHANKFKIFKI